jgi:two-component system, NtrC family, sensor kinase
MKKYFSLALTLFSFVLLHAQYRVTFKIKEKTAINHDSIYVTGTFSNWDSTANNKYLMKPHGEKEKSITLMLSAGTMRYKFHRGSWFTVEKQYYGSEVPDRIVSITRDTTFIDSVASWRDQIFTDKRQDASMEKSDTGRIKIFYAIAANYAFYPEFYNIDSALSYAQKALLLQQKIMASGEYRSWDNGYSIYLQEIIATLFHSLGNYPKSLELRLENLKLAEKEKEKFILVDAIRNIASDYIAMKDYPNVLFYSKIMDSILNRQDTSGTRFLFAHREAVYMRSSAFYELHFLDSALYYAKKRAEIDSKFNDMADLVFGKLLLADIYVGMGNTGSAMYNYRFVIVNIPNYIGHIAARAQSGMAKLFQKEGRFDSALVYARQALSYFQNNKPSVQSWGENSDTYIAEISPLVAELYQANNQPDSAYKYLHLSVTLKDSLYNTDRIRQFQTLGFNEAVRRQQLEQQSREAKQQYDTRVKIYGLIAGILAVMIVAFMLYRNNKHKQKANTLLQVQKQEIETTLGELRNTQKQLIQSEKMASLGELTAGIAHEIQNPLNFVNNFSEVNTELIEEMKTELKAGNTADAIAIADDISDNEQKINHHGKRADAIVKGMLQHSRSSSGVKEPTDINALADEYLRLAYHGLRAKDKSFNATMKTDYDETIGNINIIPQDIGRVILNLITNAFYAAPLPPEGGFTDPNYKHTPTVWVSTKKTGNKVFISVRDNGPGIPQKILDKIFQPFFTTKPTGQGTGLGLSLSYDIVKAHGGELKVETKEGEGSEFIISIPTNNI